MQKRLTVRLKKLGDGLASRNKSSPSADHLCKPCHDLILTHNHLKNIPTSPLPNGLVGLELPQTQIHLSAGKQDVYPTFSGLLHAAGTGCELCKLLYDAIGCHRESHEETWHDMLEAGNRVKIEFRYECVSELGTRSIGPGEWPTMLSTLQAVIKPSNGPQSFKEIILSFRISCDSGSAVADHLRIYWRNPTPCTMSAKNLEMMRNRPPRLVLVSSLRRLPRFIALSYCWGPTGSMRLTTTSSTISERLAGLRIDQIPRTFDDAFAVTRALGFHYVWIDALCIVQDELEDWEMEAAKMGNIYQSASLTIAATSAESTNDGFLDREQLVNNVRIPFASKTNPDITGHFNISFLPENRTNDFLNFQFSKWNQRGWTFQERLLSRRIILFGNRQLSFECRKHRRLENYDGNLNRTLTILKNLQTTNDCSVLQMSWIGIVEQYCARQFTFDKDRLPALASLAREILNLVDERQQEQILSGSDSFEYLAGHWRKGIEYGLIWYTQGETERKPNLSFSVYQSNPAASHNEPTVKHPSWSWVSSCSSAQILWPRLNGLESLQSMAPLLDARISLSGSDRLGGVTAGALKFEGFIAPILFANSFTDYADVWCCKELFPSSCNGPYSLNVAWLTFLCTTTPDTRFRRWLGIVLGSAGLDKQDLCIKYQDGHSEIWSDQALGSHWDDLRNIEDGRSIELPFRRLGMFHCDGQRDYWAPYLVMDDIDLFSGFRMKRFQYTII